MGAVDYDKNATVGIDQDSFRYLAFKLISSTLEWTLETECRKQGLWSLVIGHGFP